MINCASLVCHYPGHKKSTCHQGEHHQLFLQTCLVLVQPCTFWNIFVFTHTHILFLYYLVVFCSFPWVQNLYLSLWMFLMPESKIGAIKQTASHTVISSFYLALMAGNVPLLYSNNTFNTTLFNTKTVLDFWNSLISIYQLHQELFINVTMHHYWSSRQNNTVEESWY